MKTLTTQYSQFTPEERARLTLAAYERGDRTEADRLAGSCPQVTRVVLDPQYVVRLASIGVAVHAEMIPWMDVSMRVVLCALNTETCSGEDVALGAKADAAWKRWSALWRGIDMGISKFCADAELTGDQLLALAGGWPEAVELARRLLHLDARADRGCEKAVRQRLWRAWQIGSEP
jgi:hypothetical protein